MIIVRWIRAFVDFWISFIVGDDWTVAATVLAALLASWGLVRAGLPAWWLLPAAVIAITTVSLRRATKHARRPTRT
jgi:fatty acid desaturase